MLSHLTAIHLMTLAVFMWPRIVRYVGSLNLLQMGLLPSETVPQSDKMRTL